MKEFKETKLNINKQVAKITLEKGREEYQFSTFGMKKESIEVAISKSHLWDNHDKHVVPEEVARILIKKLIETGFQLTEAVGGKGEGELDISKMVTSEYGKISLGSWNIIHFWDDYNVKRGA